MQSSLSKEAPSDSGEQAALLAQLLVWDLPIIAISTAGVLAVHLKWNAPAMLACAIFTTLDFFIVLGARALARRGRIAEAVWATSGGLWLVACGLARVVPVAYPILALVAGLPIVVATLYGPPRLLLRIVASSLVAVAFVTWASLHPALLSLANLPASAPQVALALGIPSITSLYCLSVWHAHLRLRRAHGELRAAHQRAVRSEEQLERKVAKRTRALEHSRQQLGRAYGETIRAGRARARFVAAASHDLRQPVHALGLFAEALQHADDPQHCHQLSRKVFDCSRVLQEMLDGLLDLSRLEARDVEPRCVDFPLNELFRRLARTLEPIAASASLTLRFRETNAIVHVDPALLERIVANLLSNALKYTRRGGVLCACRGRGAGLRIEVWDTGVGIEKSSRASIFGEFVRLGGSAVVPGLGLGLSIVERLAQSLKLEVGLRSTVGRGSVFHVSVPAGRRGKHGRLEGIGADPVQPQLRGRVLLIEDDPNTGLATQQLLQGWGMQVTVAASVSEALAVVKRGSVPDLLLADYSLSATSTGVDAIRSIRETLGRSIPAALLSGQVELVRKPAQDWGLPVLTKPVAPAKLRALVHSLSRREEPCGSTSDATLSENRSATRASR